MLIDFTVNNFRSIKEPVTLSAVASTHKGNKKDDEIAAPYSFPLRKLYLLPVLGIFGANSSGKSNVINALSELISYLYFGANKDVPHRNLNFVIPFKLDAETSNLPTRFELRALLAGNIYIFQLNVFQNLVLEEKLEYIPKDSIRASSRLIFHRCWNKKSKKYTVKNGKDFGETYKEIQISLNENQSFLGFLINNLKNPFIEPFTGWLRTYWDSVSLNNDFFDYHMACFVAFKDKTSIRQISEILKKFDVGIEDIEIREVRHEKSNGRDFEVWVTHNTINGKPQKWLLSEESLGTQKLFQLATRLLFTINTAGLMLVDELGSNTHPNINREIVRLFQNEKTNKKRAQLIFTSHDSTLLRKGVLRRDQVWFTQKNKDQSTELYSLSNFRPRNDLIIDRAYLDGRFQGVPFLPNEDELGELVEVN